MTDPVRWEPDLQLVAAVLSTPKAARPMAELSDPDRSWLVAGLTMRGVTAQDIADRLGCSLRLIRAIRAEPMTQMVVLWQEAEAAAEDRLRAEACEHRLTRRELADVGAERDRLQMQLEQVLDKLMTGTLTALPCGHPRVDWNTYGYVDRSGPAARERVLCRECGRERASRYRERRKPAGRGGRSHHGVTVLHAVSVASGS